MNRIRGKIVLASVTAGFLSLIFLLGLYDRLDLNIYDAWFRLRGPEKPDGQVIIVAMDEKSVNELGATPWPRSIHALLLERLALARIVAFDLTFENDTQPREDQAFAGAVARHGRVILPVKASFRQSPEGMIQSYEMPIESLIDSVAGLGFVNMPVDMDQIVRHALLVDDNKDIGALVPSFALAIYLEAENISSDSMKLSPGSLQAGEQQVPLNPSGQALIDFYGPSSTIETISYVDILNGDYPAEHFTDKIIIVGSTTQERRDVYDTPFSTSNLMISGSPPTPGAELHATIVENLLNQQWKSEISRGWLVPAIFLGVYLCVFSLSRKHPVRSALIAGGYLGAAILLNYGAWRMGFYYSGISVPAAVLAGYLANTGRDYISSELEKRRMRANFARYVSPALVDQILENPGELQLGGIKRTITIMFVDIRDFTRYSEKRPAEETVKRLNEYLGMMSEVILNHGGTLDKYLGYGLMALFGAPVAFEDHIERALESALEIEAGIDALNAKWARSGEPPFRTGYGINTGPAVVGNIGSRTRMDYTAIGEDVNLASRMEGLSKQFNSPIVISGRTVEMMTPGEFSSRMRYLGEADVKGFSLPIPCWTIE